MRLKKMKTKLYKKDALVNFIIHFPDCECYVVW